jgi:NADPH2 dehydrogenase
MCQYEADDGLINAWHFQHYGSLACSDAALVVIEATGVVPEGRISPKCTGLWNDQQEAAFKELVANMHRFGTKVSLQLTHAGRRSSLVPGYASHVALKPEEGAWTTYAPSAISDGRGHPVPVELDDAGMVRIILAFMEATQRAVRAGFDMVEIQCAHGFLMHEFLSPIANHRTDQYGGSLEHRMSFPLQVLQAMRNAMPADMPLGMRVSGSEWPSEGQASFNIDEVVAFCNAAKRIGVDMVDVSSIGSGNGQIPFGPLFQVPFAEAVKRGSDVVTRAVGLITTPFEAEDILQQGKADLIAIGRGFLYNPRWVWHAMHALRVEPQWSKHYISLNGRMWPFAANAAAWGRK